MVMDYLEYCFILLKLKIINVFCVLFIAQKIKQDFGRYNCRFFEFSIYQIENRGLAFFISTRQ